MDWQAHYETGDTPWDEGSPHPALLDFTAASGPFQGRILIPGCGLGHEVRAVSTTTNFVTGLDIAPAAIARARQLPKSGAEQYVAGDLFDLPAEMRSAFDWVIEHTCFCAIEPAMRDRYAAGVASALKPGGHLFAVFYLQPAADHHPPYGVAVAELDRLFSPHFELIRQWPPARTFEDRESRELIRLLRTKPVAMGRWPMRE